MDTSVWLAAICASSWLRAVGPTLDTVVGLSPRGDDRPDLCLSDFREKKSTSYMTITASVTRIGPGCSCCCCCCCWGRGGGRTTMQGDARLAHLRLAQLLVRQRAHTKQFNTCFHGITKLAVLFVAIPGSQVCSINRWESKGCRSCVFSVYSLRFCDRLYLIACTGSYAGRDANGCRLRLASALQCNRYR